MRLARVILGVLLCLLLAAPALAGDGGHTQRGAGAGRDPEGASRGPGGGTLRGDDPAQVRSWIETYNIKGLSYDHWAAGHILNAVDAGFLTVKDGDQINPDAPVMLYQASQTVLEALQEPVAGLTPQQMAGKMAAMGLLVGPATQDRQVTRLEAALMEARLVSYTKPALRLVDMKTVYQDWAAIGAAYQDQVYWVTIQRRLFAGFPDHTFRPNDPFTVGQFATVMERVLTTP